jgi:glucose/arabinose dehydrogenase
MRDSTSVRTFGGKFLSARGSKVLALILLASSAAFAALVLWRATNAFVESTPKPSSEEVFEINSGSISVVKKGLFPRNQRLVLAISEESNYAYVASRTEDSLLVLDAESLQQVSLYSIQDLFFSNLKGYSGQESFIFDLEYSNGALFTSFVLSDRKPDTCDIYAIAKAEVHGSGLSKSSEVWRSSICRSVVESDYFWPDFTGRMAITDSHIYLTAGFSSMDMLKESYPETAMQGVEISIEEELQNNILFGKLTQIEIKSGLSQIFAEGFRSPSGLAISSGQNGDMELWLADHGPRGGDELNRVTQGGNYGWPYVTLGSSYGLSVSPTLPLRYHTHEGFDEPVFSWTPSIAPSHLITLDTYAFSPFDWKPSDFVLGTLKDESFYIIRIGNANEVIKSERVAIGHRARDLASSRDALLITTDDGMIMRISPTTNYERLTDGTFPSLIPRSLLELPIIREIVSAADSVVAALIVLKNAIV